MKFLCLIFLMIFAFTTTKSLNIQCLVFKQGQCTQCPYNSHLHQNQCYQNITACLIYQYYPGIAQCTQFSSQCLLNSNTTKTISSIVVTSNVSSKTSTFSSTNTSTTSSRMYYYNVDQYGQGTFSYICLCDAVNDKLFNLCNKYMLTGQYNHFISKTAQPVISVSTNLNGAVRQFKILYEGSGGNLLLSIISINIDTTVIQLLSFVSIGTTQVVQNCIDYSLQIQCIQCASGYHLQQRNGQYNCYQNIDGCSSYFNGICLKCSGFLLLIQNRCVSQCNSISDCRSIIFYHNLINFSISSQSNQNILVISRLPF